MPRLVFYPDRFKSKEGDVIELEEMTVTNVAADRNEKILMEFGDGTAVDFYDFMDVQEKIEEQWEWGHIPPQKARNISKSLKDSIRMMETVLESKEGGGDFTTTEQLKLDMLKEELRKLEQQQQT